MFIPVYSIQASDICGLRHSPSTVYDDLAAAQNQGLATIGSNQVYCVRAINPIGCDFGGYKSNPTCASILISWESSFSGIVRGRDNTGKVPIKDVIITWAFVSFPSIINAVQNQAITNEDGKFVEINSKELDVNIQA